MYKCCPKCGYERGGVGVTITGTDFTSDPPMTVKIGGNDCTSIQVVNDTTLSNDYAPAYGADLNIGNWDQGFRLRLGVLAGDNTCLRLYIQMRSNAYKPRQRPPPP